MLMVMPAGLAWDYLWFYVSHPRLIGSSRHDNFDNKQDPTYVPPGSTIPNIAVRVSRGTSER